VYHSWRDRVSIVTRSVQVKRPGQAVGAGDWGKVEVEVKVKARVKVRVEVEVKVEGASPI
jgi:hypothetical protein